MDLTHYENNLWLQSTGVNIFLINTRNFLLTVADSDTLHWNLKQGNLRKEAKWRTEEYNEFCPRLHNDSPAKEMDPSSSQKRSIVMTYFVLKVLHAAGRNTHPSDIFNSVRLMTNSCLMDS